MLAWSRVDVTRVNHLLRRFRLYDLVDPSGPVLDATAGAVNAMTGSEVQAFHQQLLNTGLPFRVNVHGSAYTDHQDGDAHALDRYGFASPPITVTPTLVHGISSWPDFLHLLRSSITYLAQKVERGPSNIRWIGIEKLELTYVPQDNLAAFLPHLPPMHGGAWHHLPEDLENKKCVVSIRNEDNQCFRCCLISWKLKLYLQPHSERWNLYLQQRKGKKPKNWSPEYLECGLDLSMLPTDRESTLDDVTQVEKANTGLGINVYLWHAATVDDVTQNFPLVARLPANPREVTQEVFLLLYRKHWFLITDFQRFACQRSFAVSRFAGTSHDAAHTCHRCFENFGADESLRKHVVQCMGVWEQPTPPPRLPSTKKPDDRTHIYFENHKHAFMHPLVVYADIETFFTEDDFEVSCNTKAYGENRRIASIGMHSVGCQGLVVPEEFQAQIFVNDGVVDPFKEFLRKLFRLAMFWKFSRTNQEALSMTPSAVRAYAAAKACQHCRVPFGPDVVKCRDHDHVTGAFRAALCTNCNARARIPNVLKVFTHNGTGYDHHFYILGLCNLMNCEDSQKSISAFANASAEWACFGDETLLTDCKLEIMAESSEKLRCIKFGKGDLQIQFLDSLKFVKNSLDGLIKSQRDFYQHDLTSGFRNMTMHHPMICHYGDGECLVRLKLLLQKIPFPYKKMTDPSFWSSTALLPKEAYYDDLRNKPISDERYEELQHIIAVLGITTARQLHDVYLHTDVLALADCFQTFREKFHSTAGLDPFHKLGLPGAAWDALLKNSGAYIENVTEEACNGKGAELMQYIDQNIRGGLSCAFVGYSLARNPNCPGYTPCKPEEHVWIKDFDATSLYPFCMTMPLPVGEYFDMGGTDTGIGKEQALAFLSGILDEYTAESSIGYMLIVRMEIPKVLHDFWDYAPAANRQVRWSELSKRQQQSHRRMHLDGFAGEQRARKLAAMLRGDGDKKLVPDLNPHDRKAIHVEHAQELRKYGAVFTELYKCYSFKQSRVFQKEIERCASERADSKDEAVRDILKLRMNAPYGKTLENKRDRKNFHVHTDPAKFQKHASFKRSCEFRIQHSCPEDGSFLGVTVAQKTKAAVLDTPRMIGWTILEYAKLVMMRFHYGVMKPLFKDGLKLLYTDTDSMYYEICYPTDPIDFIAERNEELKVFDLSQVARYKDCPQKNKLGCFKYEGAGNKKGIPGDDNEIVEAVFLAPKSYIKRMAKVKKAGGSNLEIKGKGIPAAVLAAKFDNIDRYKEVLFTNRAAAASFRQFRSINHVVKHCDVSKTALSGENSKVFQVSPYESRPLGHWRNLEAENSCPEWDLEDSDDEAVQLAKEMIAKGVLPPLAEAHDHEDIAAASDEDCNED